MKNLLILLSLVSLCQTSVLAQSYWFNGLTRFPARGLPGEGEEEGDPEGGVSVSFAALSHSMDYENLSFLEFSGYALGIEGAPVSKKYFELEFGVDIGLAVMESDIMVDDFGDFIDETYLGIALKGGALLKYEHKISDGLTIIPFVRAGLLIDMATNDLFILTAGLASATGTSLYADPYYGSVYNPYGTGYYYGETWFNIFANYSIGSSVIWNKWRLGLEFGKYQPIAGDWTDIDEEVGEEFMPDPYFLKFSVGRKFNKGSLVLGYRLEFWDFDLGDSTQIEWTGYACDISFQSAF